MSSPEQKEDGSGGGMLDIARQWRRSPTAPSNGLKRVTRADQQSHMRPVSGHSLTHSLTAIHVLGRSMVPRKSVVLVASCQLHSFTAPSSCTRLG